MKRKIIPVISLNNKKATAEKSAHGIRGSDGPTISIRGGSRRRKPRIFSEGFRNLLEMNTVWNCVRFRQSGRTAVRTLRKFPERRRATFSGR